jgi:hypothetical protein
MSKASEGMKQYFLHKYTNITTKIDIFFVIEATTLAIDKNYHTLLDLPLKKKTF